MTKNLIHILTLAVLTFLLLLLNTGCGDTEIISARCTKDVVVDGKNTGWPGNNTDISTASASLKVCNDSTGLYLSLTSRNNALLQRIVATGLTVWLDPQTKTGKIIGIHYPIGLMSGPMPEMDPESFGPPDTAKDKIIQKLTDFEVLNEDKSVIEKKKCSEVKDIQLAIGEDTNLFVYEMRIPIGKKNENSYTIVPDSSGYIRLGLETGELDFPMMGPPPGGMPPPDGGGGGMPPPDGGGGPPPGMRPGGMGKIVYLDCWFRVKLQR